MADGQAALDAVRAQPFDLVISDVMMPGLDGLQLVGELRAHSRAPDLPVLLLSARAGQEAAIEGLEAARTTTWSSRSRPPSCWPGSGRPWNWPGCAATTPGGGPR